MKKVFVSIFAVVGVIAVIGAIFGIFVIHALVSDEKPSTGVIQKDGGEVLYIADTNASGKGGTIFRFVKNDGVMLADRPDILDNTIVGSTEFIPQKSGRCIIVAEEYFCNDPINEKVFDVTVDENLKISYAYSYVHRFSLYKDISFEDCRMTVQKGESTVAVSKQTAVKIGDEMSVIYGRQTAGQVNAPDLSECAKIICTQSADGYARTVEFYVCGNKLYYCNIIAGDEQWYEFTPADFCSLDGINELLDLKD